MRAVPCRLDGVVGVGVTIAAARRPWSLPDSVQLSLYSSTRGDGLQRPRERSVYQARALRGRSASQRLWFAMGRDPKKNALAKFLTAEIGVPGSLAGTMLRGAGMSDLPFMWMMDRFNFRRNFASTCRLS